ncbi:unknown protein (plasmid) [Synechocystis sp. PCC 6803]|uniref:Uncharacterized protein n=1 Tax=Synechocystis sp. (strain ATCC 27184 / PCC 6803 / Kazusa) TaxID=1111708 RepID=Q6ZEB2_SYNY3|nr:MULTISPECIES: hypothetical protein [unclassified Synechocystis]AGF53640.1 hypothetical protein MYO_4840 [Synechocystis sp. PCC 6803]AVP91489.1 hypothetical protein C7I86_17105 [Synechocystis sp. IPPAS B-1465]MBD2618883.1 hypothetical protein [Synechocystis sp. FACHB-898]MBD2637374.1 hypothetical protein [Synechocystis sp. FACHB-908]MBD2661607.1 hypothetical protein [Synechocystis sp. FACHB-929]
MPNFDPRTINKQAFQSLQALRHQAGQDNALLKEQKNQAMELYTYLSTWGLMRLKAEEVALSQTGKKQVVQRFFNDLGTLSGRNNLADSQGLNTLVALSANEYLGLTGLGIELANEFGFWANAVYHDITGAQ